MRERLEVHRGKKHKEEMMEPVKSSVRKVVSWSRDNEIQNSTGESTKEEKVELCAKPRDDKDAEDARSENNAQEPESTFITKATYLLYFLLWVMLYAIALEYEFGAVYFILSALFFIWLNTRSGPKQRGEPSAYSVFNPNCEPIEGTLDATQFEREIIYGIGGVR